MHNSAQESGQQQYGAPGHTSGQAQGGTGAADEAPVPDFIDTASAAASLVQSAGYSWLA
jgi:hypothetical protein